MSDLINRMRLEAEDLHCLNPASETVKCLSLGADEIERLNAEVLEQCRLNGMGAEREARLMAQLTEAQAREQQLRAVLDDIKWYRRPGGSPSRYAHEIEVKAQRGLALPADSTALDALIKAERAKERERISKFVSTYPYYDDVESTVNAIRELGDE